VHFEVELSTLIKNFERILFSIQSLFKTLSIIFFAEPQTSPSIDLKQSTNSFPAQAKKNKT
jgi:hypothetical protein